MLAALHARCWRVSVTCRWPLGRERLRAAARLLGLQQHEGLHCWARVVVTVTPVMGTLADALGDSDAMGDDKEENMWWRETGTAAPLAARPSCCQCHWQHVKLFLDVARVARIAGLDSKFKYMPSSSTFNSARPFWSHTICWHATGMLAVATHVAKLDCKTLLFRPVWHGECNHPRSNNVHRTLPPCP